jgi:hypothetical protein
VGSQCEATTKAGRPCMAAAMSGSPWCFIHNPATAQARADARRRGGLRVHGLDPEAPEPQVRIRVIRDCLELLETAGGDCLRMEPSLSRARALAHVAATAARILEVSELEERVRTLELTVRPQEPEPWKRRA